MRASSAPASRHKAAAWRASGSSCRPADAPSKMPHTWASRSARPAARSRSSLTAAACSSPVRSRHRAWCRAVPVSWATRSRSAADAKRSWFTVPGSNAQAIISSKLADYHGNRAVRLPWVVTFPVSFSSCTRNGLSRVSAPDDGELTRADTRPSPSQVSLAKQPVRLDGMLVRAAGSALVRSLMLHGSRRPAPGGMSRTLPVTSLTVACPPGRRGQEPGRRTRARARCGN